MGIFKKYVNQTRKPEGFMGKMMIKGMNIGHAKVSDWGISHLKGIEPSEILEVGCGGGRNVAKLLKKFPKAKITAIDYSPLSVEKTKEFNKYMIEASRCTVKEANVANLDLQTEKFDLVTAFETIYFWPGLEHCFEEIFNVMKKDGVFLIVNEVSETSKSGEKFEKIIEGMKVYKTDQIKTALKKAGFFEVISYEQEGKPWVAFMSKK